MCWRLIPSTLTSAGSTGKNKAANYPPILLSVKIAEWGNQTNLKIMRKMFSVFANVAQGVKTVTAVKSEFPLQLDLVHFTISVLNLGFMASLMQCMLSNILM